MATKSKAVPTVEFTATESTGITAREVYDSQPGIIRGWKMASDPVLIEARKAANAQRIAEGTARLLAELS